MSSGPHGPIFSYVLRIQLFLIFSLQVSGVLVVGHGAPTPLLVPITSCSDDADTTSRNCCYRVSKVEPISAILSLLIKSQVVYEMHTCFE